MYHRNSRFAARTGPQRLSLHYDLVDGRSTPSARRRENKVHPRRDMPDVIESRLQGHDPAPRDIEHVGLPPAGQEQDAPDNRWNPL